MLLLAIIEQNAKEIRNALGNTADVLEHHSNIVVPRQNADALDEREGLCENWRANVVCTTLVQFLDTLFSGRMNCIRRFQALCESVIVIDEVQSVPVSMLSEFHLMINFLTEVCGAAVVLCSATQPVGVTVPHPLLPAIDLVPCEPARFAAFRRTVILPPSGDPMTMAEIAEECARHIAQVDTLMVGCNTRAEAAELFGMLREMGLPCVHLSAAMCTAHRSQTLERIEKRRLGEKLVCVSTQAIEYGVNVSFQRVFRIMTGLDEVIQIAGRCNRHGEDSQNPGQVQMLKLKGEHLPDALHAIRQAQNATEFVLDRYRKDPSRFDGRLDSDAAVNAYHRLLYRHLKDDSMDDPLGAHRSTMLDMLSVHSNGEEKDAPAYFLHQAFREAGEQFRVFSEDTTDLIVPFGEGASLLGALCAMDLKHRTLAAERIVRGLRPFSVSVYRRQLARLEAVGAIEIIQPDALDLWAVRPGFYDPLMGLMPKT